MIAAVGRGVAEAQAALDRAAIEATLAVYDADGAEGTALLREIGYRPTFYVLPETICEVNVSMRVGGSGGADGSANLLSGQKAILGPRTYVTPVDATFANRFAFQGNASAKLTFKIVPVPPPAALDDNRPVPQLIGREGNAVPSLVVAAGLGASFIDKNGKPLETPKLEKFIVVGQQPAALGLMSVGSSVTVTLQPKA